MLPTYKAIVRGNHIEWCSDMTEHITSDQAIAVHITILDEPIKTRIEGQGQRMAAALERLAEIHALADVRDPVAWQNEVRQDRPLPGRGA